MVFRTKFPAKTALLMGAAALLALAPVGTAWAQASGQSDRLQSALRDLARDPRNVYALSNAGSASLALGDVEAAIGFLSRAEQLSPRDARVKLALGQALLRQENPIAALGYFDAAARLGAPERELLADQAFALDLVGRSEDAQAGYRRALQLDPGSDQLTHRYAVSLAISGRLDEANRVMDPLLRKQDGAAWRSRAMMFAMNDQQRDAREVADATMPPALAAAIRPFFVRMPKLTPAQKAAMVHFGHFPASENIGVDLASVRRASSSASGIAAVRGGTGADAGLIPLGEPLGQNVERPKVLAMPDRRQRRRPDFGRRTLAERAAEREAGGMTAVILDRSTLPEPAAAGRGVAAAAAVTSAPGETAAAPAPAPAPTPAAGTAPLATGELAAIGPAVRAPAAPTTTNAASPASAPTPTPTPSPSPAPAIAPVRPGFGSVAPVAATPSTGAPATANPPLVAATVQRRVPIGRINPVLPPTPAAEPPPVVAQAAPILPPVAQPIAESPSKLPEQLVPGFDLATVPQTTSTPAAAAQTTAPTPEPTPASTPTPQRDLAELIETLEIPAAEKQRQVAAVDLARITPARPAPPPAPKPTPATAETKAKPKAAPAPAPVKPASPGKYWVQVATGSDLNALRFDYRRLARQQAELFKAVAGYTSPWGKTRRLVVGPFASLSEAKAFEAKFRAGGGDGFAWVSDGDTAIEALPAK